MIRSNHIGESSGASWLRVCSKPPHAHDGDHTCNSRSLRFRLRRHALRGGGRASADRPSWRFHARRLTRCFNKGGVLKYINSERKERSRKAQLKDAARGHFRWPRGTPTTINRKMGGPRASRRDPLPPDPAWPARGRRRPGRRGGARSTGGRAAWGAGPQTAG